jgi:hypothetical protein
MPRVCSSHVYRNEFEMTGLIQEAKNQAQSPVEFTAMLLTSGIRFDMIQKIYMQMRDPILQAHGSIDTMHR